MTIKTGIIFYQNDRNKDDIQITFKSDPLLSKIELLEILHISTKALKRRIEKDEQNETKS